MAASSSTSSSDGYDRERDDDARVDVEDFYDVMKNVGGGDSEDLAWFIQRGRQPHPCSELTPLLPASSRPFKRISVAGAIGVGKTTLATALANVLGVPFVPEPHTCNSYFEDFYRDRKEFALRAQLTFMLHRIQHHIHMTDDAQFCGGFVQERSAFEDYVFAERMKAQGDMQERDFDLYGGFYDLFARTHGEEVPDAIVVLDARVETLIQRVRARARAGESIDAEYLASFAVHYEAFIERMAKMTTVFRVDWNTERTAGSMHDTARQLIAAMEGAGARGGVVTIDM